MHQCSVGGAGICHVSVLCKLIYFRTARAFLALGRYRRTLTSHEGILGVFYGFVIPEYISIVGDVGRCRIELIVLRLPRLRQLIWDLPWYSPIVIPGCLLVLRTANAWYLRSRV